MDGSINSRSRALQHPGKIAVRISRPVDEVVNGVRSPFPERGCSVADLDRFLSSR
jgi:hypothetical protein